MTNSAADSTVVLRVNINCCNACPKKVKKLLLKVKGVVSVDVDRENSLVSVTGKADTNLLIKAIGKMKKKAEIVPNKATTEEKKAEATTKEEGNASQNAEKDEDGHVPPPTNCYCQEYRPMPPAYYAPWMSSRQDEFMHYYPGQYYPSYGNYNHYYHY